MTEHGPWRRRKDYVPQYSRVPDRRKIEDPIGIVRRLMTALENGRKFPTLRPDILPSLVWYKDDTSRCSLCRDVIGSGDNDELPVILWRNVERGSLCFHSLCLLKSIHWKDWADLR